MELELELQIGGGISKRAITGGGEQSVRDGSDFYKTPRHAVESLLFKEKFTGKIWECACGDGAISKVLEENKMEVISTDLFMHGFGSGGINFLDSKLLAKQIITNPPYSMATQFIYHAQRIGVQKWAFLLKLNFLEGQARKKLFQETPLKTVHVFSRRISFDSSKKQGKGRGLLAFAWFVWENNFEGKPQIDWI